MGCNTDYVFLSYSRRDQEFALRLAKDLRTAGVPIWLDQLDIAPGSNWDEMVESALKNAAKILVLLSENSCRSDNVLDEISYALKEDKPIIPLLLQPVSVPLRLTRLQHEDFTGEYAIALRRLLLRLRSVDRRTDALQVITETAILGASQSAQGVGNSLGSVSGSSVEPSVPGPPNREAVPSLSSQRSISVTPVTVGTRIRANRRLWVGAAGASLSLSVVLVGGFVTRWRAQNVMSKEAAAVQALPVSAQPQPIVKAAPAASTRSEPSPTPVQPSWMSLLYADACRTPCCRGAACIGASETRCSSGVTCIAGDCTENLREEELWVLTLAGVREPNGTSSNIPNPVVCVTPGTYRTRSCLDKICRDPTKACAGIPVRGADLVRLGLDIEVRERSDVGRLVGQAPKVKHEEGIRRTALCNGLAFTVQRTPTTVHAATRGLAGSMRIAAQRESPKGEMKVIFYLRPQSN